MPITEVVPKPVKPGTQCRVCAHEHRSEIEEMYTNVSPRGISDWLLRQGFEPVKEYALNNHFNKCIAGAIVRGARAARSADAFTSRIEGMLDRLDGYLEEFDQEKALCAQCGVDIEKSGMKDWRGLSGLLREWREAMALYGKVLGHVRSDIEINVIESPQFKAVVMPIVQVTAKCAHCGPTVERVLTEGDE